MASGTRCKFCGWAEGHSPACLTGLQDNNNNYANAANMAGQTYSGAIFGQAIAGRYVQQPDRPVEVYTIDQTAPHVRALRKAFPGVWIRDDGAFRAEIEAINWSPPTAELLQQNNGDRDSYWARDRGWVVCGSRDYKMAGAILSLEQLEALAGYLKAEMKR